MYNVARSSVCSCGRTEMATKAPDVEQLFPGSHDARPVRSRPDRRDTGYESIEPTDDKELGLADFLPSTGH